MAAEKVVVPSFLREWPWPRRLNPHYEQVKKESCQWIHSLDLFDPKSQEAFDRCDFSKLAMLSYPHHDKARSRTCCDLMALLYAFDEYTDVEDEQVTQYMGDILMDALRNPDKVRPAGEVPLGEMAASFWRLAQKTSTKTAQNHFIEGMQDYCDGVVLQAKDRFNDTVRTFDEYWRIRRLDGACLPTFTLLELEFDFPDEVYRHPSLERLRDLSLFAITLANDVFSYNVERAKGHALHNLVTVIMYAHEMGPQDAVNWIGSWNDKIIDEFRFLNDNLPAWGNPLDFQVKQYISGLAGWIRGAEEWTLESQRYFGKLVTEVRETRTIYMLPKVEALEARLLTHRVEVDSERHAVAALQIRRDLVSQTTGILAG